MFRCSLIFLALTALIAAACSADSIITRDGSSYSGNFLGAKNGTPDAVSPLEPGWQRRVVRPREEVNRKVRECRTFVSFHLDTALIAMVSSSCV